MTKQQVTESDQSTKKQKKFKWWYIVIAVIAVCIIGSFIGRDSTPASSNASGQTTAQSLPDDTKSRVEKAEQSNETKAQSLLDGAKSRFEKADYSGMISKCDKILSDYPDTEIAKSVPTFISDLNKTATQITSVDLCAEYAANEVKADSNYKGKLIVITGTIDSIGKDILDDVYVTLSNGEKYSLINTHCTFKNEQQINAVAELEKGTEISIIGQCDGASVGSPMIQDCYIVK